MQIDTKPKILNRLSRIEGQVRGIARMVDEDRYCIDLLTQLRAVRAALLRVETEVLRCQSASKRDPLSACNRDPLLRFVMDVTSAPLARVGA